MKLSLRPGEKLVEQYRKSESTLLKPLMVFMLAIYLPWYFALSYDLADRYTTWLLFWTLLVVVYGIRSYVVWSSTKYIITSDRLIHINREGFFKTIVTELEIDDITNVRYKKTGISAALFKYGDIEIETQGRAEPLILEQIRDPETVRDFIWNMRRNFTKSTIYIQKP